jgi:hypothetical protein
MRMEGMISHYAKCLFGIICNGSGISCTNLQASNLAPPQKILLRASAPALVRIFKMTLQIMVLNCWVCVLFFACRLSAI